MSPLPWSEFVARQAVRAERSRSAAEALLHGRRAPAQALLRSWRFAESALCKVIVDRLLARPPAPRPAHVQAVLGDLSALPPCPPAPESEHRIRAAGEVEPPDRTTEGARLAFALESLAWLGHEIEVSLRQPWLHARSERSAEADDAHTLELWRAWCGGRPWEVRQAWEERFLGVVRRSFAGVVLARGVPKERWRTVLPDLQEGFFWALVGRSQQTAGWREVALRVLETDGDGPIDGLAASMDAHARSRAAWCAITRGHGPTTASLTLPSTSRRWARMVVLADAWAEDPTQVEAWLDAHVAIRLIDRWTVPEHSDPRQAWRVVTQNRGRARGRLRAVLLSCWDSAAVEERLLGLDALTARTRVALARWARDWAWQQLARDFAFDGGRPVDVPCPLDDDDPASLQTEPLSPAVHASLRTWVALVCLRGRLEHLQRWARTGSTGDRDSRWGRLLADALPTQVREACGGLDGLRARLRTDLDDMTREIHPLLGELCGLELERPGLSTRFQQALEPWWADSVPRPRTRYRSYVERARDVVVTLESQELPW